ncbi:MAG: hypothetical protein K0Q59_3244 [Paenibacillus sp.]|nr:hypothetical protein [Paenibacillus sp.]
MKAKALYLLFIYAAAVAVLLLYKDELADWMANDRPSVLACFALAVGFATFPVLPYKIIIGMLGFMFGPLVGFLISWTAATTASTVLYLVVRTALRRQGRAYMARFKVTDTVASAMERRPFATILAARLIPMLPQALVNVYPAFLSIKLPTYVAASALGKIPNMLLFAYLGERLFADFRSAMIVLGVYALLLAAVTTLYRLRQPKSGSESRITEANDENSIL